MWRRTTRVTLLVAWLLFLGAVAYLATHPRLVAPLAARVLTRNLFPDGRGSVRLRDFEGGFLNGCRLHQASFTLELERGGVVVVAVDTLVLDYRLKELLGKPPRLRAVTARGAAVNAQLPAPARDGGNGPGGLPHAPRVTVDRLDVRGAAEILDAAGRLQDRVTRLELEAALAAADSALRIDLRRLDVDWPTRNSRLARWYGRLALAPPGIVVDELHGQLNDRPVDLAGRRGWDRSLALKVRAAGVSADEIEDLLRERLGLRARGDLQADIAARADSVLFDGTFTGELEGYRMEGLRGRGISDQKALVWSYLAGRVNGAAFVGTGRFDLRSDSDPDFRLEGDVAGVDLSAGLVPDVELPATDGHGRVVIRRLGAADETAVAGWLADGFLDEVPFDTCRVDVVARRGVAALRQVELRRGPLWALLTGVADTSGAFDGSLDVAVDDLGGLPPQWRLPRVAGRLRGSGAVTGRDPVYRFEGEAELVGLALAPLRVDSCRVDLAVDDVLGAARGEGFAAGAGLALGGVPLGDFALAGRVAGDGAVVESFRAVRGDTAVTLHGEAAFGDSVSTYRLDRLVIDLEGQQWRTEAPLAFRAGPAGLRLDPFTLSAELGSLEAGGGYDRRADRLDGTCRFDRFDLRLLNPFVPRGALNGRFTAAVTLGGSARAPVLDLAADLLDARFRLADLDSLHLAARFAQDTLTVRRLDLRTNHGRVTAAGTVAHPGWRRVADFWPGAALGLDLEVADADWAFVDQFHIPALKRVKGRFGGRFRVEGTSRAPQAVGELVSEPFHVHWLHLERLAGRVELAPDRLTLAGLRGEQRGLVAEGRIELPLRADFLSSPVTPLDGPFRMEIRIPDGTDLAPLAQATNAFLSAGGQGGMEMVCAGPLDHPLFSGSLRVRDGRCVLRGLEEIYSGVSAVGVWDGDTLRVRDIAGSEGARGRFTGDGWLAFRGLMLKGFDVRLAADRFLVASIPYLRALVRGDEVHVTGVKVGPDSLMVPKFTGNLEVVQARYTGDFAEKPTVSDPRRATVAPDWLADLHVVGPPRTTLIANRAMELAMSGDIDVVRDLQGLYLRGSMDIDAGRMPVFNNEFKVVTGRLDFSQDQGVIPRVDITAETTVRVGSLGAYSGSRKERITAYVTGRLDQPEVAFRSESNFSRASIERLLMGLEPYAQEAQAAGGGETQAGQLRDASIAAGFNLFEREIARELDFVDTFDIERRTLGQRRAGDAADNTLIGVGKYLGQDLYVKYAQGLSEPERDLLIEYQISDHLLLQSEISRRLDVQEGATTYSLDLKYRFEY